MPELPFCGFLLVMMNWKGGKERSFDGQNRCCCFDLWC